MALSQKWIDPDWQGQVIDGDGLEVAPCVNLGGGTFERTDQAAMADIWSVYVHVAKAGPHCIADFDTKEEALRFAQAALDFWPPLAAHGIVLDFQ